jgi:hypothetical protein
MSLPKVSRHFFATMREFPRLLWKNQAKSQTPVQKYDFSKAGAKSRCQIYLETSPISRLFR